MNSSTMASAKTSRELLEEMRQKRRKVLYMVRTANIMQEFGIKVPTGEVNSAVCRVADENIAKLGYVVDRLVYDNQKISSPEIISQIKAAVRACELVNPKD